MAWLLLIFGALSALFTLNAWRPFRRNPIVGGVAFFAGWLTSELPLHHIAWQVVATAVMIHFGALEQPVGWAGLSLSLLAWGGLLGCHANALRTREVVEQAFERYLPSGALTPAAPVSWRRVALPQPSAGRAVTRHKNIVYHTIDGIGLKLDVYHHQGRPTGRPVLLQIHGGAWIMGRKDDQGLPLMHRMADDGWVCVSVNYRLSPRFTFPAPMIDIKRAIQWIKANIETYGGDPSFIAVTGGSAGGHLSALTALTANDPEYQPGFEEVDTSVKACVPFYGVYDFTNDGKIWHPRGLPRLLEQRVLKARFVDDRGAYERASPYCRIRPDAPPFLIIHGLSDTLVPVREARRFAERLGEVSEETVCYIEVPGAQHAFEVFPSVRTELAIDAAARFLEWIESRSQAMGDVGKRGAG